MEFKRENFNSHDEMIEAGRALHDEVLGNELTQRKIILTVTAMLQSTVLKPAGINDIDNSTSIVSGFFIGAQMAMRHPEWVKGIEVLFPEVFENEVGDDVLDMLPRILPIEMKN